MLADASAGDTYGSTDDVDALYPAHTLYSACSVVDMLICVCCWKQDATF